MLTDAQITARMGKLTASRIACLMRGEREAILRLWEEMIGARAEEDLSAVWPVQLGATTEQLNLDWFEKKNGVVTRRGEVVKHPLYDWAACTLDGWSTVNNCPIETKHVGGREPLEIVIERYQPQMQWQMEVTGATQCAISIIQGADAPVVEFIPRDEAYAAEMIRRGAQFMECVKHRMPPVELAPAAAPVDATKTYDMTGKNMWADQAAIWLANKAAADAYKAAEKVLKEQVPEDAKKCTGHGVRITRDRAGRLSLREAA